MEESNDIKQLLTELCNSQRNFEAEYKRVSYESLTIQREALELQKRAYESLTIQREALELQKRAVENQNRAIEAQTHSIKMQAQFGRLYRLVLIVAVIMIAFLLIRLVNL